MLTKLIIVAVILKTIFATRNIWISKKFLKKEIVLQDSIEYETRNILLLLPVLREQNIITKTLEHFKELDTNGLKVTVCVVGTEKELYEKEQTTFSLKDKYNAFLVANAKEKACVLKGMFRTGILNDLVRLDYKLSFQEFESKFNMEPLTSDVVLDWIGITEDSHIEFIYVEAKGVTGDRATQLNYAFEALSAEKNYDIVGVYDADSLPEKRTLQSVVEVMRDENIQACQQPLNFLTSIRCFEEDDINPLLTASAIYQTTWSLIKELPNLILYRQKSPKVYKRCLYLNGHGEFFRTSTIAEMGGFPKGVITDGVHIGYRMSMDERSIAPIPEFCDDEMTDNIKQMVIQHSRWYAGCMTVYKAFDWSNNRGEEPSLFRMIDGYHLQLAWGYAPILVLILIIGMTLDGAWLNIYGYFLLVSLITYNYVLPYIAIRKILNYNGKIRPLSWLLLPLASLLKSIGPNVYFFNKLKAYLSGEKMVFQKVER